MASQASPPPPESGEPRDDSPSKRARVLLVFVGIGGVASLAAAGFLSGELWLGCAVLGVACFMLLPLLRLFVFD